MEKMNKRYVGILLAMPYRIPASSTKYRTGFAPVERPRYDIFF